MHAKACGPSGLEGTHDVVRDPATEVFAWLRTDQFAIDVTGIHEARIKGDVIADLFISRCRLRITPGSILVFLRLTLHIEVRSDTFKFTGGSLFDGNEVLHPNILLRDVIH